MRSRAYLTAYVTRKDGTKIVLADKIGNVFTTAGKDQFHALCYTNASGTTRGFACIGLSEATLTPAVGDTTLGTEISTNGLARADAKAVGTVTHTGASNSTTISNVFTASGAFTDVKASALFNATSSGIMAHIANFTTGSGTLQSGDTLTVTWTCNLS